MDRHAHSQIKHSFLRCILLCTTVAAIGLGALGAGAASATSGKSTTTKSTAKPAGTTATTALLAKYIACMKANGVTITQRKPGAPRPTGTSGRGFLPAGVTPAKFEKAQAACAKYRPPSPFNSQAFAAYRNCLKLNGVTLPSGPAGLSAAPSAKMQAAEKACAALRPKGFGGGGASTTTKS